MCCIIIFLVEKNISLVFIKSKEPCTSSVNIQTPLGQQIRDNIITYQFIQYLIKKQ